jgi:hypothetical protein
LAARDLLRQPNTLKESSRFLPLLAGKCFGPRKVMVVPEEFWGGSLQLLGFVPVQHPLREVIISL